MLNLRLHIFLIIVFTLTNSAYSQNSQKLHLTEPVKIELERLGEAFQILDQFAKDVWEGWDDYMNYPFLFTFQNGLRVLVGHPAPPPEFTQSTEVNVKGLSVYIDTANYNNYLVRQPLLCGGGILTLGSFNNKPVTIVDISFISPESFQEDNMNAFNGESTILTFIHELMHCHQPKIREYRYGNLMIEPDLSFALYSDIEGQALLNAYKQSTLNESLPFIKDFCIARSLKLKDLSSSEKFFNSCDEFCEGVAVYSEFIILTGIKKGFRSSLPPESDKCYHHFADIDSLLNSYIDHLKSATGNTLEVHEKTYWYGCIEALLLERYFPSWKNEIENGAWLDQVIRKNVDISKNDSIIAINRFIDIYHRDSLENKHGAVISERDSTYRMFRERKGRIYIIDFKPISQFPGSLVDKTVKRFSFGFDYLYPDGIKELKFDKISVSFNPVPVEINQLYSVKIIDIDSSIHYKPFEMNYESADTNGFLYNVTIITPYFTLKAPKVSISESSDTVKFTIHSNI